MCIGFELTCVDAYALKVRLADTMMLFKRDRSEFLAV